MLQLFFIRHGQTPGNLGRRYIGRTDEPLSEAGRAGLARLRPPAVDAVYVSPMRRCRESAALLFPDRAAVDVPGLEECDFGAFEGKNYAELNGDAAYQAWIDSGGELPFPGGESRASFQARCCRAFAALAAELPASGASSAAFVVHGGTIMAVLSRFGLPRRGYFDWQVACGGGYACRLALTDAGPELRDIGPLAW